MPDTLPSITTHLISCLSMRKSPGIPTGKKKKSLYLYIKITEDVFSCPLSPFHFPSDQTERGLE